MKKTILLFLMTLLMSMGIKAQAGGSDFLIVLDNGTSMDDQRFSEMKLGATKLIERLLSCNPKNRVGIVHYGAGKYGDTSPSYTPVIYIESDFTNDTFVGQTIQRRLDFGDHFHEALRIIGSALDGNSDSGIISSQTTLNKDPGNPLVIVTFSDAQRNGGSIGNESYLVNYTSTGLNTSAAFKNVTVFKTIRDAKFAFVHLSTNTQAIAAAASISSFGGSYTGAVETNVDDPDYGLLPRLYFGRPDSFGISILEINYWGEVASALCNSTGWGSVGFYYEPVCGLNGQSGLTGNYTLPPGATFNGLKLKMKNTVTSEEYPVAYNPTMVAGNQFYNSFQTSDYSSLPPGSTGQYQFILTMYYSFNGSNFEVNSWNNYPFFDADINLNCGKMAPTAAIKKTGFKLTPNPTDGFFKAVLDKEITSGLLQVIDINGNTVFKKSFRDQKEIEADIHAQNQGVYIVKIISDKNEVYTEKIIKK